MPHPSTRIFRDDWAAHHRDSVETTMSATCQIIRPARQGTTQPDGGWEPGTPAVIFSGPCRVVRDSSSDESHHVMGERRMTVRRYEVQIPYDSAEVMVGDVLTVLTGDDHLVGKSLRIESDRVASEQWSRNLSTIEFEES